MVICNYGYLINKSRFYKIENLNLIKKVKVIIWNYKVYFLKKGYCYLLKKKKIRVKVEIKKLYINIFFYLYFNFIYNIKNIFSFICNNFILFKFLNKKKTKIILFFYKILKY